MLARNGYQFFSRDSPVASQVGKGLVRIEWGQWLAEFCVLIRGRFPSFSPPLPIDHQGKNPLAGRKRSTFSSLAVFHQFIVLCKSLQHELLQLDRLHRVRKTKPFLLIVAPNSMALHLPPSRPKIYKNGPSLPFPQSYLKNLTLLLVASNPRAKRTVSHRVHDHCWGRGKYK